jgi:thiamine-phosphate pyrophosphorylase
VDSLARLLDANANRAGEALRTLEDAARFGLSDRGASEGLKRLRHDLRTALRGLPGGWLHASRDAAGDVGTTVGTPEEYRRGSLLEIAIAAERRAAEALRTLEEGLKVVDPAAARLVEAARYRVYDLAASIIRRLPGRRREQWRVCVLLTESLCRRPWRDVARAAIEGGAEAIQLREKSLDGGELLDRAAWLVSIARPRGVRTIVNDRVDVALAADADGVHLGVDDLPIAAARGICGDRLLLGASTHDPDEAARAAAAGADYCGVGAMFPGGAKPGAPRTGPAYLEAYLAAHPDLPHLAIGGIDPTNIDELIRRGCRGVAVSGTVCGAERPDEVVAALRAALERQAEITA